VGSELPRVAGEPKGGEETLLSCKVCSTLCLQAAQEASLSCHRDTARKATMLEETALVPDGGQVSAVSSLLWFPRGSAVLPCPQPWRSASTAQASPCAAIRSLLCGGVQAGALACTANTPVPPHWSTTYATLFSSLRITSNSSYPRPDVQLCVHSDIQIYDFSAIEHLYLKASV